MTYRWVINRCVLLQFTWSNHWMKAQLNATLVQMQRSGCYDTKLFAIGLPRFEVRTSFAIG